MNSTNQHDEGRSEGLSDLSRIEVSPEDPFDLFKGWREEAKKFSDGNPDALCLSTVSKGGKVSARHLILRRLDADGFVIMTDNRSRKVNDLDAVPSAAMTFLWVYKTDRGETISKQVRIEGDVEKLSTGEAQELYDREPLFCKIRAYVCEQDRKIDWEELKLRHDQVLEEVRRGENTLPMPDHFVAYKLTPSMMEFYFAKDHFIADRVLYQKERQADQWKHHRIAA